MKTQLTLFLFILYSISYSQNSIQGKITLDGQPFEMVNVYIKNTKKGTITDVNGNYSLKNIPEGKNTIIISSVGFTTQRKQIILSTTNNITANFKLQAENNALDEVVVSGTMKAVKKLDSPVPVEVFSPTFFKKNPAPSIFEAMENVNGVRPQVNCSVCNTGDIHINGLEGPYTFVLIDGMPIVSGLSTVYGLSGIPQALIERVEIVKGPASTLYGSEAVGGIINVITKKPSSAPLLTVDTFASSWGEINADIGLKYNTGKSNSLLGISYFNYKNVIDNNNDNFTDLAIQDRISIFNKTSFQRKNNRIFNIAGRYIYEDRWGGDIDWESKYRGGNEIYGESIYTSRWETFGNYQLPTDEKITLQFSANGHNQNSYYGETFFDADQYIGFGQFVYDTTFGKNHDILMGLAYRYTYYDDNTAATETALKNEPSITHLPGIYIQDEITLTPKNKLLIGARYDYNSIHGGVFSPRINYKWNSDNNEDVLRIGFGNGFRVANVFTEDHAALTGNREVLFIGELKPETSWNGNINYVKKIVSKNNTIINLDASAFYTYFSNKIIPDYETDPTKIIYANLDGHSVSKGISLNTDINFNNGLSILAGATLMDVSTTEDGKTEKQILTESFSATWSISYKIAPINLSIDYTGNVYGPMDLPLLNTDEFQNDPRDATSPWYSIQNIQLTKKFSNSFEVFGGVKNLLNFTPASNSILRSDDPFDQNVDPENPNLVFDPAYVYASNQGIRMFLGLRYKLL